MKKKLTAIFLCVALVAIAVAGATLAYFTDTKEVKNTFTMGKVEIDLKEDSWKENEDHTLSPSKVYAKDPTITLKTGSMESYIFLKMELTNYKALAYVMAADADKDENIDFSINSCMDNGTFSVEKFWSMYTGNSKATFQKILGKWFKGIDHWKWEVIGTPTMDNTKLTLNLAYIGGAEKTEDVVGPIVKAGTSIKFMESFGMPATVDQDMITKAGFSGNVEMNFTAYAVQAQGFENWNEAWTNTFGQPANP